MIYLRKLKTRGELVDKMFTQRKNEYLMKYIPGAVH